MKKPIDLSKKQVFRNTIIRDYDKPRMLKGYVNTQLHKSSKARILVIRKQDKRRVLSQAQDSV
mgnify:CR=1 FL=1